MNRPYVIGLIVTSGIFIFALLFYAMGGSDESGNNAQGNLQQAPANDVSQADADRSTRTPGSYAGTPSGERSTLGSASNGPSRITNTSGSNNPSTPRRTETSNSTLSNLERLRQQVNQANAATGQADPSNDTQTPPTTTTAQTGDPTNTQEPGELTTSVFDSPVTDEADSPTKGAGSTVARGENTGTDTTTFGRTNTPTNTTNHHRATQAGANQPASTDDTVTRRNVTQSPTTTRQNQDGGTYIIQSGDTFERIAIQLYGDATLWDEIGKANPMVDPLRLRVGQEIRLPSAAVVEQARHTAVPGEQPSAPSAIKTYTISTGDSLSSIAAEHYGDSERWRYLYNVNRQTIGPNPDNIKVGQKLRIPPYPTTAE